VRSRWMSSSSVDGHSLQVSSRFQTGSLLWLNPIPNTAGEALQGCSIMRDTSLQALRRQGDRDGSVRGA